MPSLKPVAEAVNITRAAAGQGSSLLRQGSTFPGLQHLSGFDFTLLQPVWAEQAFVAR
ncbi:hypothetical protein SD961_11270 [Erwinia sp. MMLR14_017]|uniref:hypothetical protein n=1 Tax=Erwinia sp. MMLR14_017 TaxID=3093842 RepID=UPI002990434E|nr:hypothetical protein [Erwinia sp. MMLR14_017]MDW8846465.1 hypothetical protein [Erwinia sp. MMLR14_017]